MGILRVGTREENSRVMQLLLFSTNRRSLPILSTVSLLAFPVAFRTCFVFSPISVPSMFSVAGSALDFTPPNIVCVWGKDVRKNLVKKNV
jgi:hypothetical protein